MRFFTIFLFFAFFVLGDDYSIAILSDLHIGESSLQIQLATEAVSAINSKIEAERILFVIITGDISNTAQPSQMKEAKEILDQLEVPYLPILGNHDVWTYNKTWEEPSPTGDALFASIFSPVFKSFPYGSLVYPNTPTWDPLLNITVTCQNWELTYNGTIFYGLDWNTRWHAIYALGYLGAMPGCALHEYPGGTFDWLQSRLTHLKDTQSQIITFQHQPYDLPLVVPGFVYAFGEEQKNAIRNLLAHTHPIEQYWGVIAGHMHIWWDSPAFPRQENWNSFHQWETCACKRSAAFSLGQISAGKLVSLTKHYGDGQLHAPNKYLCGEKVYQAPFPHLAEHLVSI